MENDQKFIGEHAQLGLGIIKDRLLGL